MKRLIILFSLVICLIPMNLSANDKCVSGDCTDGKGIMKYADGREYSGQFKNGKPDGQGILKYESGKRYKGLFKNGLENGPGTLFNKFGRIEKQIIWKNGEPFKNLYPIPKIVLRIIYLIFIILLLYDYFYRTIDKRLFNVILSSRLALLFLTLITWIIFLNDHFNWVPIQYFLYYDRWYTYYNAFLFISLIFFFTTLTAWKRIITQTKQVTLAIDTLTRQIGNEKGYHVVESGLKLLIVTLVFLQLDNIWLLMYLLIS